MRAQGGQTNAKEDTVLLLLASVTDDVSQYNIDLTSSGSGGYESTSARGAQTGEREIYVRWTATKTEASAALAYHGNTGITDYTWLVATDGSGYLCCYQNASAVWQSAATVDADDYSIAWSMRDNPQTTGASDAKISEVCVYDHTTAGIWEIAQFTHAAPTTNASWNLSVSGIWDGAALVNTPTNATAKVRVSTAYHPNVEFFEDWLAARTAYAGDQTPIAEPVGPLPISSGLGDMGQFAGRHPWGYAAAHAEAVRRRCWAPLVNAVYGDAQELVVTPAPTQWAVLGPGSSKYYMMLSYLKWTAVPRGATHAWVRVHVVSYVTSGASVPIGVRIYAMNRPPAKHKIGPVQAPSLEVYHATATLDADHGSAAGTGAWLSLGWVRLPRFRQALGGWTDTVHLALAYDIDPAAASANDAAERLIIDAWHVRPDFRQGVGVLEL